METPLLPLALLQSPPLGLIEPQRFFAGAPFGRPRFQPGAGGALALSPSPRVETPGYVTAPRQTAVGARLGRVPGLVWVADLDQAPAGGAAGDIL